MKKLTVTATISTKDRYFTTLPLAIASIAQQTIGPEKLIIYDDGDHLDLRKEAIYNSLFALLQNKGIAWEVVFGEKKGQVLNHQKAINKSTTDLIWRVDDDDLPEPNVLQCLLQTIEPDDVAVVSGRVLMPSQSPLPESICSGKIEDMWGKPNLQWADLKGVREVEHLNNTFLYRRRLALHGYCMNLTPVGHGEESLFTYGFIRAGYRILLEPKAIIWHMREPNGGIRAYKDSSLWAKDSATTKQILAEWGVNLNEYELVVLNCGLGDHLAFKMMLPELLEKKKNKIIQLAVCYPEVFKDDGVHLLSISDAIAISGDIEKYSIYKWMWDNKWDRSLVEAFRKFYL